MSNNDCSQLWFLIGCLTDDEKDRKKANVARATYYIFWSVIMKSIVKEAPAEQMVFKLALEFSVLLSQPPGTPWHIKLLSFDLVFV